MLFVALFSFNISAQSLESKLAKTWISEVEYLDSQNFSVQCLVLTSNGEGGWAISIHSETTLDDYSNIEADFTISAPIQWSCSGTTLYYSFNFDECNFEVENLSVNTTDQALKDTMEQMNEYFKQMFIDEFKKNYFSSSSNIYTYTNVSIDGNTMTAYDEDGKRITFTNED